VTDSEAQPEDGASQRSPDSEPEDPIPDPEDPENPLPWLANMSPAEYEHLRRYLARERGWRVATLDRLYRQARRKAGQR
jgi:hypothetical protein